MVDLTHGCILNLMRFCWLCLVVLALLFSVALAQKSGGGAGGRSGFGSSPAPRVNPSPSPSIPLPTPRSSPSSPSAPILIFPNNNTGESDGDFDLAALVFLVVIGVIAYNMISGLRKAASGGGGGSGAAPEAQVVRLRLAVLHSAALQRSLRDLAARADTQNTRGLADLVDDSAALLLREDAAWKFGSFDSWKGSLAQAEAKFDQFVTDERSEYVETLRNFEGKTRADSEYKPQLAPDGRYLLVSLVLAVRGELDAVPTPLRTASARLALLALSGSTPLTTLASYLSWTPEADGEALTEDELLVGWPKLELL